ncbi:zinc-binding dehydrogenase [Streptomyces sp. NPDC026666]|uniref:zinc-binding dehydrogenase n=1 Tax=Streptomyces sp. NPDC026666 TaxID=3154799 RepID=UPI003451A647
MKAAGADIVLPDRPESVAIAKELIGDAPVRLGVDGVGGAATLNLASLLTENSALVAYSAVSGDPMHVPYFILTSKRATVHGFFAGARDYVTETAPAIREAGALIASGDLVVPVAGVYTLDKIQDALDHLFRGGKILLDLRASTAGN